MHLEAMKEVPASESICLFPKKFPQTSCLRLLLEISQIFNSELLVKSRKVRTRGRLP